VDSSSKAEATTAAAEASRGASGIPEWNRKRYKDAAIEMLASLNSDSYQSGKSKPSFLLHSVGHWPAHSEIDASIIYADYYYIEALLRLKRLQEGKNVIK
jgi:unsaturated chondroitin disaccharide hydrolase